MTKLDAAIEAVRHAWNCADIDIDNMNMVNAALLTRDPTQALRKQAFGPQRIVEAPYSADEIKAARLLSRRLRRALNILVKP